ncbi:hypothetical protein ACX9NF_12820 [Mycobacterium sp. ML1]
MTTISGRDLRTPLAVQLTNMTKNLKRLTPVAEKFGVVIGIEPTNTNEAGFPECWSTMCLTLTKS